MPKVYATSAEPLADIEEKVFAGERLSFEDGVRLMRTNDLLSLGRMADHVRRQKHGDVCYFITNRHINPTNVCVCRCLFCAFSRDPDDDDAYTMTLDEVEERVAQAAPNTTEIHIVGGLHPALPLSYYEEMLRRIKALRPEVHIQGFTAVEIAHLADLEGLDDREVLLRLKEAGLGFLPGGGAEVFSPRVREKVFPKKANADRWLSIHGLAHELGMPTNATILYGHVETLEERVDHLVRLREQQDRSQGFVAFIPLPYLPKNTLLPDQPFTTGFDDLKVLAVSRLMLDNFPHIKAFWIMLGTKLAQVSLSFGVSDLDGTVEEEHIAHSAGADTAQHTSAPALVHLIRNAGQRPIERDTAYNVVRTEW